MTLAQFLGALKTEATLVLKNLSDNTVIAEMKASGFASLDNTIEARTIAQWSIEGGPRITVLLNEAETSTTPSSTEGGE